MGRKNNDAKNDTKTSGQNHECRTEMPLIKVGTTGEKEDLGIKEFSFGHVKFELLVINSNGDHK